MDWLTKRGRRPSYSVGVVITEQIHEHVLKSPATASSPALETNGEIRDGSWIAELTGDLLDGGMRLIVRPGPTPARS